MAPSNGSARNRRNGAGKQAPKPAIPLPHVKRQAAAAAAASSTVTSPPPSAPDFDRRGTDGAPQPGPLAAGQEQKFESRPKDAIELETVQSNGHDPAGARGASDDKPKTPAQTVGSTSTVTAELRYVDHHVEASSAAPSSETLATTNGVTSKTEPKQKPVEQPAAQFPRSRLQPSVSPTRYHMPPAFQPAGRPMGNMVNGDMQRATKLPVQNGPGPGPGPLHLHQSHRSNGSVQFGAFPGSASSSPAPPHSGGIVPPPGMPAPDGRQPYVAHGMNGYPPMMPYMPDMMQGANMDNFGRPAAPAPYGPMESYPPYGNNFGPSTPHSFHDSQSSANPEDGGVYMQYPHGGPRNGMGPQGDELPLHNQQGRPFGAPDYPRMMPNPAFPPPMVSHADDADGLVGYLQQSFGSPDLADCTLELRYLDDRAPPVRIPGHQIVFARSPELSSMLRNQRLQSNPSDRSMQMILLETDNKWLRSDSFYMATQRLYGLPLLLIPPSRHNMEMGNAMMDVGSVGDRLDFALSYAAAGHLLGWSPIVRRGCEIVTHLLDWSVLEKCLEFALEGYSDKGSHEVYKYGDGSRMILNAIVTFIVHTLPPNFNLDPSVQALAAYSRLPVNPLQPPGPPTIAQGSTVRMAKGRRSQQLNHIQFGDLSLSDAKDGNGIEQAQLQQPPSVSQEILSRVLINLPFPQLKMILESSGSGNVSGWANAENRYRVIKDAVAEREARRLRAVAAVVAGRVPDVEAIRSCLGSPEPRHMDLWSVLGWKEEILPYDSANGPALGRRWTPLAPPQNDVRASYV